jgi:hypothetical protein
MLADFSGICIGIEGTKRYRRFVIKKEKNGCSPLYWDGNGFSPDRAQALVFDDFNEAREKAWELRGDFFWYWVDSSSTNN